MKKERVQEILDKMEQGKYTGFPISQITDNIAWLWKWRKITREEMERMTEQVCIILEMKVY